MRVCLNCGKNIRDGADFCTSCGAPAPASAPNYNSESAQGADNGASSAGFHPGAAAHSATGGLTTDVPLITLAPERNPLSKQRLLRTGKLMLAVVSVIIIAIGGVFAAAYLKVDPNKDNPFVESSLSGESYRQCRALVNDVRNENFDLIINDIIQMQGDFKDYNFLMHYEELFEEIVPDDCNDSTAIKYRDCCYFVSYTEFLAKKYENYASSGLLAALYLDDAERYRNHADTLWNKLENAQTEEHLQVIIDYCSENEIIYLKDTPVSSPSDLSE